MKTREIDTNSVSSTRKCQKLFLAGALSLFVAVPVFAEAIDVESLVKQANTEIRASERQMHSGQNDEAIAGLQSVQLLIESIKQEDPTNTNISSLESKLNRMVKSIERKTGRDLGGGSGTLQASTPQALPDKPEVKEVGHASSPTSSTPPPSTSSAPTSKPPSTTSASPGALSYQVRQLLKEAETNVKSAEDKVKMLEQPKYAKMTLSQKTKMVEKTATRARQKLEQAKQLAAEEGITDQPEISDLEQRLAAVDNLVAADTAKVDQQAQQNATKGAAMKADFESLQAAREAAESALGKYAGGGAIYYNKLEEADAMLVAIEKFESNDKQALLQQQTDFGEKYGTTAEEIDGNAKSVGYWPMYNAPSAAYLGITELTQQIDQGRVAMAEDLATRSGQMVTSPNIHDFFVRENYQDARNWLSLAAKFSPDNALVIKEQQTIDSRIDAGLKIFYEKIDARTWPPESATGGSSDYQPVAKDYFVQSKDWAKRAKNPYTVLDLEVSGPWSVQKMDLFKNPVMYGLPVVVAVELEKDKKDNLARVFHMTLRTPESASPQAAPPFTSDTVGNSYFIRKTAIK